MGGSVRGPVAAWYREPVLLPPGARPFWFCILFGGHTAAGGPLTDLEPAACRRDRAWPRAA